MPDVRELEIDEEASRLTGETVYKITPEWDAAVSEEAELFDVDDGGPIDDPSVSKTVMYDTDLDEDERAELIEKLRARRDKKGVVKEEGEEKEDADDEDFKLSRVETEEDEEDSTVYDFDPEDASSMSEEEAKRLMKANRGLLKEIRNLRSARSNDRLELDDLRNRLEALEKPIGSDIKLESIEPLPEHLEDDPAARYVWEQRKREVEQKNAQIRQRAENERLQQRMASQFVSSQRNAQESVTEFAKSQPLIEDAYQFARQVLAKEISARDINHLNAAEYATILNWQKQGRDVATEIWNYAVDNGFEEYVKQNRLHVKRTEPNVQEKREVISPKKRQRIRRTVQSKSPSDLRGGSNETGMLSIANFHARTTEEQRVGLYQKYPKAQEQILETGKIDARYLEKISDL